MRRMKQERIEIIKARRVGIEIALWVVCKK